MSSGRARGGSDAYFETDDSDKFASLPKRPLEAIKVAANARDVCIVVDHDLALIKIWLQKRAGKT
jgi:hypothetical protein